MNVETVQCSYITSTNETNIKSFIAKEKVLVKIGTFSFHFRFRVVKGLTYGVILGMDWWRLCEPTVDLVKGRIVVKERLRFITFLWNPKALCLRECLP